jgi:hypothetical protein
MLLVAHPTSKPSIYNTVINPKSPILDLIPQESADEETGAKGELALIRAFVDRKVKDALGLSVDIQRHYCRAARQWMEDGDSIEPFSLVWCCLALNKDHQRFVAFAKRLKFMSCEQILELVRSGLEAHRSPYVGIKSGGRDIFSSGICRRGRPRVKRVPHWPRRRGKLDQP